MKTIVIIYIILLIFLSLDFLNIAEGITVDSLDIIEQGDDSPFGANAEGVPSGMEAFSKIGIKWIRAHLPWYELEPDKGNFRWDLEYFDKYIEAAKKNNIKILGLLNGTPPWTSSAPADSISSTIVLSSPKDLKDYENYVYQVVNRYKGSVKYWEIWNEPDICPIGQGDLKEFVALMKVAWTTIKKIDPQAKVLSPGLNGLFSNFLDGILRNGGGEYFDIYSDHAYLYEQDLKDRLDQIRKIMGKYGYNKPIWITEQAYNCKVVDTGDKETDEAKYKRLSQVQAESLIKMYISPLEYGVEKVFWYRVGQDTSIYAHENLGLCYEWANYKDLKPAGAAYHTLVKEISSSIYYTYIPFGINTRCYVFMRMDKPILVLWSEETEDIDINTGNTTVEVVDIYGSRRKINTDKGMLRIKITKTPMYIEGVKKYGVLMQKGFSSQKIIINQPGKTYSPEIDIKNPYPFDIAGKITIKTPDKINAIQDTFDVGIKKNSNENIKIKLKNATDISFGRYWISVEADFGHDIGRFYANIENKVINSISIVGIEPKKTKDNGILVVLKLVNNTESSLRGDIRITSDVSDLKIQPSIFKNIDMNENIEFMIKGDNVNNFDKLYVNIDLNNGENIKKEFPFDFLVCIKTNQPIEFTGNISKWDSSNIGNINEARQIKFVNVKTWEGTDDLSAKIYTMWDDKNFYLAADVRDNIFFQPYSNFEPVWEADGLQVAFDTLFDRTTFPDNDDYELGLTLTPKGPQVCIFSAPLRGFTLMNEAILKCTKTSKGMLYEAKIPWVSIGIIPEVRKKIGFSILVNDNDGNGRKYGEWTTGIGEGKWPNLFGRLVLVE